MILLENLFYLLVIILLVLSCFYIIKVVYLYIKQSIKLKYIVLPQKEIFSIIPTSKSAKALLLFFILTNFVAHMANRDKWINKETLHHDAKEYFATNLSLQFYRKTLSSIFVVDSKVMKPLNLFSEYLYEKGEKLLPKDDGEKYYWKYIFFNYFYVRGTGYMPGNDYKNPKPITPHQTKILESTKEIMRALATMPIGDSKINREKYKTYIAMANYYTTYRIVPYNEYVIAGLGDARKAAYKDEAFIKDISLFLDWTLRLQEEYRKELSLKKEIEQETPVLGVSYYIVIQDLTGDILFKHLLNHTFSCDDSKIKIYLDAALGLVAKDSPLWNMGKSQQVFVKDFNYDNMYYKTILYTLNQQCGHFIEYGYPSNKWIENELPSIKKQWLNTKKEENATSYEFLFNISTQGKN